MPAMILVGATIAGRRPWRPLKGSTASLPADSVVGTWAMSGSCGVALPGPAAQRSHTLQPLTRRNLCSHARAEHARIRDGWLAVETSGMGGASQSLSDSTGRSDFHAGQESAEGGQPAAWPHSECNTPCDITPAPSPLRSGSAHWRARRVLHTWSRSRGAAPDWRGACPPPLAAH